MAESRPGSLLGGSARRETARPSAPELIAATLREAIIGGTIRAGTQLRQSEVAAEFGVSVIPVREALRRLEAEGFVALHPHRGAVVPEISLDEIADALARGDRVELRGFGAFSIRARGARVGRNPRTGNEVAVPSKVVPHFRTGKALHDRLNLPDQPAALLRPPRK